MLPRCVICNIHRTADPYRVCDECRGKAARGWPRYPALVARAERAAEAAAVADDVPAGPGDRLFCALMGWR